MTEALADCEGRREAAEAAAEAAEAAVAAVRQELTSVQAELAAAREMEALLSRADVFSKSRRMTGGLPQEWIAASRSLGSSNGRRNGWGSGGSGVSGVGAESAGQPQEGESPAEP